MSASFGHIEAEVFRYGFSSLQVTHLGVMDMAFYAKLIEFKVLWGCLGPKPQHGVGLFRLPSTTQD
ncbi:hypothetical protein [Arthrobacter alpinus]|uniref:hypothetical protein n=1 Tax=Arthrobacter alpinus TaxID=656366 RepID=UPI0005C9C077|nr:hypothetical protein [Arthrobacter alpinus]